MNCFSRGSLDKSYSMFTIGCSTVVTHATLSSLQDQLLAYVIILQVKTRNEIGYSGS